MMSRGYDARAIANLILDEAEGRGLKLTNLKLQKLLFLCHALFLVQRGRPLVHGSFEAWQYGPVSREANESFRRFGRSIITERATARNPATGAHREIPSATDLEARATVSRVVEFYGNWSAGQLVDLTHAKNGPWDYVVRESAGKANFGLRISDRTIVERFKYLWFGAKQNSRTAEPHEDHPLLPETDLARIALLPTDEKVIALRKFRSGRPRHSWAPFRGALKGIFNTRKALLDLPPCVLADVEAAITRACRANQTGLSRTWNSGACSSSTRQHPVSMHSSTALPLSRSDLVPR
jgi:uncharacterized phage-associated protein